MNDTSTFAPYNGILFWFSIIVIFLLLFVVLYYFIFNLGSFSQSCYSSSNQACLTNYLYTFTNYDAETQDFFYKNNITKKVDKLIKKPYLEDGDYYLLLCYFLLVPFDFPQSARLPECSPNLEGILCRELCKNLRNNEIPTFVELDSYISLDSKYFIDYQLLKRILFKFIILKIEILDLQKVFDQNPRVEILEQTKEENILNTVLYKSTNFKLVEPFEFDYLRLNMSNLWLYAAKVFNFKIDWIYIKGLTNWNALTIPRSFLYNNFIIGDNQLIYPTPISLQRTNDFQTGSLFPKEITKDSVVYENVKVSINKNNATVSYDTLKNLSFTFNFPKQVFEDLSKDSITLNIYKPFESWKSNSLDRALIIFKFRGTKSNYSIEDKNTYFIINLYNIQNFHFSFLKI